MELAVFRERISRPTLKPNRRKIAETILFLIEEAERRGTYATKYDLLKSVFVADTAHLNNYGRPITYDNYYAMKDGPVPSDIYNMLTDDDTQDFAREIEGWPLWQKEPSPSDGVGVLKYVRPKRSPNIRVLSETDISALREAFSLIKAQTFIQTRDMTHEHPAYREAWVKDGEKGSYHMSYDLLMDCQDDDSIADVVHASHYA